MEEKIPEHLSFTFPNKILYNSFMHLERNNGPLLCYKVKPIELLSQKPAEKDSPEY